MTDITLTDRWTTRMGPVTGLLRVSHGGSWGGGYRDYAKSCRSAVRDRSPTDGRYPILGLRVSLVPAEAVGPTPGEQRAGTISNPGPTLDSAVKAKDREKYNRLLEEAYQAKLADPVYLSTRSTAIPRGYLDGPEVQIKSLRSCLSRLVEHPVGVEPTKIPVNPSFWPTIDGRIAEAEWNGARN